jgi:Leucine-rich repeat (LRR) protein
VSDSPALHSRWPLLLKIEIFSNAQNCSILSQKVPKFELYKHNDELLNIYYGIFYEEISIFSNGGHLGYRTVLTDTILKGDHLRIISAKFGKWPKLLYFKPESAQI